MAFFVGTGFSDFSSMPKKSSAPFSSVSREIMSQASEVFRGMEISRFFPATAELGAWPVPRRALIFGSISSALSANAAGAVSYRWTLNGAAVAGGEDGDLAVEWEKAKSGTTETYAVTPVYDICGNAVDGAPLTATVEFIPDGSLLLFR